MKLKAVFLDRDGTINIDRKCVYKKENFEFFPDTAEGLKLLSNYFKLFIITNQSGIGRGYYTLADMHDLHEFMLDELKKHDVEIGGIFYCPHDPDLHCGCRKPSIGMITQAEDKYGPFDYRNSWVIGDKTSDISVGRKLGSNTVLIKSGYWDENDLFNFKPTFVAYSLLGAARKILDVGDVPGQYVDNGIYLYNGKFVVNVRIQDGVEHCGEYIDLEEAKKVWIDSQRILNGNVFDKVPNLRS
jgi:D-glycero-D-manno-heptose 1,7-bisphosphate phosphatase